MTEFYGLAGLEPYNRVNQIAGFPGGRVGKWENRSNNTVPNQYITEQTVGRDELADHGHRASCSS